MLDLIRSVIPNSVIVVAASAAASTFIGVPVSVAVAITVGALVGIHAARIF